MQVYSSELHFALLHFSESFDINTYWYSKTKHWCQFHKPTDAGSIAIPKWMCDILQMDPKKMSIITDYIKMTLLWCNLAQKAVSFSMEIYQVINFIPFLMQFASAIIMHSLFVKSRFVSSTSTKFFLSILSLKIIE